MRGSAAEGMWWWGEGGELCLRLWGVCSFCSAGINVAHVSASSLFITFQHRQSHFYDFPVSIYVFLFIFFLSFLWLFEKCFQFFASVDKTTKAKVERKKSSGSVRKSLNWKFIWPFLLVFHCRTCSCPAWLRCHPLLQSVKCKAPVVCRQLPVCERSIATIWRLQSQFRIQFQLHLSTLSTCHSLPIEMGECSNFHSHAHFHFHSLCRIYSFKIRVRTYDLGLEDVAMSVRDPIIIRFINSPSFLALIDLLSVGHCN